jgi:hypothetical protein
LQGGSVEEMVDAEGNITEQVTRLTPRNKAKIIFVLGGKLVYFMIYNHIFHHP